MTYDEYKELSRKNTGLRKPKTNITSLAEYKALRADLELFEEKDIADELTVEDYIAWDRNFDLLMDRISEDDPEDPFFCEINQSLEMMSAVGWEWATVGTPSKEQFMDQIRYLYQNCLVEGKARTRISTGGITVEIDIIDHQVSVSFGNIDESEWDEPEY